VANGGPHYGPRKFHRLGLMLPMAISSMTGFAREAGVTGPFQWAWEIKTVNGRGLEARVRTPPGFDAIGEEARGQVLKALVRGQGQITLNVTKTAMVPRVRVNREVLEALVAAVGELQLPDTVKPASVDGLLAVRGVIEIDEEPEDGSQAALQEVLSTALARTIEALKTARMGEGRSLGAILGQQLETIERLVNEADAAPARQPQAVLARLRSQVAQLLDAQGSLDPDRLHQEAMLIAARADVREELDRLQAHIESARALLAQGSAVGRRLDFLAQEFGREANTLCAKANDVSLSRIGLELKAVIEQFREQVQNVE